MGYNFLLVDDSSTIRLIIKKALKQSGIVADSIYEAEDGIIALEVMKSRKIDMVITDLNMPRMGGLEMLDRMSEDDELKQKSVIIVSSESSGIVINMAVKKGAKWFLKKPFTAEAIKEAIIKILEPI